MVILDGLRLFLFWIAIPIGIFLVLQVCRHWMYGAKSKSQAPLCPCGYPLEGLDLARCPECGRVIGFNATAEDLGLTQEQLERAQRKRAERAAATSSSASPAASSFRHHSSPDQSTESNPASDPKGPKSA